MLVTLPDYETTSHDSSCSQTACGASETSTSLRDNESELSSETSSLADNYEIDPNGDIISAFPLCEVLDLEDTAVRRKREPRSNPAGSLLSYTIPKGSAVSPELDDDSIPDVYSSLFKTPSKYADQAEEFVKQVWAAGWKVAHHHTLPAWLKDNSYLVRGHRVPNNSFRACFKSIFRIHSETGNIWTHLIGMVAFIGIFIYFLSRPSIEIQWQEKTVFCTFFLGAILCLGFSWMFHTCLCHSERVGLIFKKLDYLGIALLIVCHFIPWLYYSFYCRPALQITYLALTLVLGTICIIVSMWDKFTEPKYRTFRAGTFVALSCSGFVPLLHWVNTDGFWNAVNHAALGWMILMCSLYLVGACVYALRIPESIFPGKFDIWFQSHQIFHVIVLAAAFVQYHGIAEIANYQLTLGDCSAREELK